MRHLNTEAERRKQHTCCIQEHKAKIHIDRCKMIINMAPFYVLLVRLLNARGHN